MKDQKKSLLVVKSEDRLSIEQAERLKKMVDSAVNKLGMECIVIDKGLDASVCHDNSELISAMQIQIESINKMTANNQRLIALMAEMLANMSGGAEEIQPTKVYLDGSPMNGQ